MRPEGVRLIPPRDESALLSAIEESLAIPRTPKQPSTANENHNLRSVLDLYRELAG
jgi:hypothetical protein